MLDFDPNDLYDLPPWAYLVIAGAALLISLVAIAGFVVN